MADVNYDNYGIAAALGQLAQAQQLMATRPQKSLVKTTTTSSSTPRALEDMIMRRNSIGANNQRLLDALKGRETWNYNLGAGLANLAPVQGYGDWGVNALRAFGGAMNRPTDAQIAREQAAQELAQKDLETALAYDKAMGETQTQTQQQSTDYIELPYGGATQGQNGGAGSQQQIPVIMPSYWEQMVKNFDKARPTEASYRNQNQVVRKIENKTTFAGDKDEAYARQQFDLIKGKNFLPIARNTLKGSGPITDFEDQKYTDWLNNANDPVALKDTAKMIVDDVAIKNNWTQSQKANALDALGLSSMQMELLPQQVQYEPERVKTEETSIDAILKKHGAKRVD